VRKRERGRRSGEGRERKGGREERERYTFTTPLKKSLFNFIP